jgi:hypothetical protein
VSPSSQDPKEEKNVNDGIASINKQLELLQYQMQQRIQNMQDMDGKASYLLQQMATGKGPFQQQGNNNNASKRKTKICSKFAQHGCCPYAERCNFAHGEHELLVRALIPDQALSLAQPLLCDSAIRRAETRMTWMFLVEF